MDARTALHLLGQRARTDSRRTVSVPGMAESPPFLTAFVTRQREEIGDLHLPASAAVVVLEGRKELELAGDRRSFGPGEVIVLRAGTRLDVVNAPDPDTGCYRALFLGFPRRTEIEAARRWPRYTGGHTEGHAGDRTDAMAALSALPLQGALAEALVHFAEGFRDPGSHSAAQTEHRLLGVMLVLAEAGALRLSPKYTAQSVAEGLRLLLRHRLHDDWTAADAARALSLSEATLRRRLSDEGESFAGILRGERLAAAHLLLSERGADVTDTMAATGFRSRSHFARQFRNRFGMLPSEVRARESDAVASGNPD